MNRKMGKDVLVIGAGISGIATALRLAKKGYRVKIIEKNSQAGGRLNQIKKDGFTFDTGPSFFSMSYEFEEFARDCRIKLPFEYIELDPLYSVSFSENSESFIIYKDLKKLSEQFAGIEPDFEKKISDYLSRSGKLFHDTIDLVIKKNFNSLFHYFITLARVNPLHLPKLFQSFWDQAERSFSSSEMRQIISLTAFFLGRTPFDTSAIYTLLSYTEFKHDGYYNVKGGMYKIVEGLVSELKQENVEIIYNTEIVGFGCNDNTINHFVDHNGNKWMADVYVVNADAAVFRGRVLKKAGFSEKRLDKMSWTMAYLTFYIGLKCKLPHVHHHNYYLGTNFREYANNVMQNPGTFEKPYYYVNVLSKHNPDCAPEGCESLFFVCPVPNLQYKKNWEDRDIIVESIIDDFSKRTGKDLSSEIVSKTVYTPIEWQRQFNLYKGSGLGLSHKMLQIGGFRPANFDEDFRDVFYTGSSTVPGAGLPMSIISSKLVVERIENSGRLK